MSLFGCIIDSYPLNSDFQQIGENTFTLPIDNVALVPHISVFVFDPTVFAEYGANIFLDVMGPNGNVVNNYVGYMTDYSPSTTFKVPLPSILTSFGLVKEGQFVEINSIDLTLLPPLTAQIRIEVVGTEDIITKSFYMPTETENQILNYTADNMIQSLTNTLSKTKKWLDDGYGNVYPSEVFPLVSLTRWKESYCRIAANKTW